MAVTKLLLFVATIGSAISLGVATSGRADGLSALEGKSKGSIITFEDVLGVWENIIENEEDDMWKYERAKELKEFMDTHSIDNAARKFKRDVLDIMVEVGEIDIERCLSDKLKHLDDERTLYNYRSEPRQYIRYHRKRFSTLCASIVNKPSASHATGSLRYYLSKLGINV